MCYMNVMRSVIGVLCLSSTLPAMAAGGCGDVRPAMDGAAPGMLGTRENPARTCAELQVAGMPSAAYWVRHPSGVDPDFQVYCEQQFNGGGWAMLENSVRREDGTTTAFWQFGYDDRLKPLGTPSADENYYDGSLYLIGRQYMDVFTDLLDTTRLAALMTATGINPTTMKFTDPRWVGGIFEVYSSQFAAGWSARDHDEDEDMNRNCASDFGEVAQHYGACWIYNLGADREDDANGSRFDGGVGPHVENAFLVDLRLSLQPDGGFYSQVKRIARFTRW